MSKSLIGTLLLFITGLGVMLYPAISDLWNRRWNDQMITSYDHAVRQYSKETLKDEWRKAREYNAQHRVNTIIDAFEHDAYIKTHPYMDLLNPGGDGIMGYVKIPKIQEEIIIFHGTSAKALERGCGHVEGTSLPAGGKGTHAVLAAHRGLPTAKLFSDLDKLEEGDAFYLKILDKHLAYQVDQISEVKPDQLDILAIEDDKDYVSLLTCTPYGVNTHRLIVRGHRIPYTGHEEVKSPLRAFLESWQFKVAAAVVLMLAVYFVLRWKRRKGGRGRENGEIQKNDVE